MVSRRGGKSSDEKTDEGDKKKREKRRKQAMQKTFSRLSNPSGPRWKNGASIRMDERSEKELKRTDEGDKREI